jgi:hypothetical protein
MVDVLHVVYRILAFPGTLTIVTILAAFVAWALYGKQRRDKRRDLATIILHEIEKAEDLISEARRAVQDAEAGNVSQKVQVMKIDTWDEAQHVLAGRLPQDVVKRIGEFYADCRLLDEALEHIDGAFVKNETEIRANEFRVNAEYRKWAVDNLKLNPNYDPKVDEENKQLAAEAERLRQSFNDTFPTLYGYRPVKPTNDAKRILGTLPTDLSQTRVGQKLRRVRLGFFRRHFSHNDD